MVVCVCVSVFVSVSVCLSVSVSVCACIALNRYVQAVSHQYEVSNVVGEEKGPSAITI